MSFVTRAHDLVIIDFRFRLYVLMLIIVIVLQIVVVACPHFTGEQKQISPKPYSTPNSAQKMAGDGALVVKVDVEYCGAWGYEPRYDELRNEILNAFPSALVSGKVSGNWFAPTELLFGLYLIWWGPVDGGY